MDIWEILADSRGELLYDFNHAVDAAKNGEGMHVVCHLGAAASEIAKAIFRSKCSHEKPIVFGDAQSEQGKQLEEDVVSFLAATGGVPAAGPRAFVFQLLLDRFKKLLAEHGDELLAAAVEALVDFIETFIKKA